MAFIQLNLCLFRQPYTWRYRLDRTPSFTVPAPTFARHIGIHWRSFRASLLLDSGFHTLRLRIFRPAGSLVISFAARRSLFLCILSAWLSFVLAHTAISTAYRRCASGWIPYISGSPLSPRSAALSRRISTIEFIGAPNLYWRDPESIPAGFAEVLTRRNSTTEKQEGAANMMMRESSARYLRQL